MPRGQLMQMPDDDTIIKEMAAPKVKLVTPAHQQPTLKNREKINTKFMLSMSLLFMVIACGLALILSNHATSPEVVTAQVETPVVEIPITIPAKPVDLLSILTKE